MSAVPPIPSRRPRRWTPDELRADYIARGERVPEWLDRPMRDGEILASVVPATFKGFAPIHRYRCSHCDDGERHGCRHCRNDDERRRLKEYRAWQDRRVAWIGGWHDA